MILHNPDDPGSTSPLVSGGPRLGRFSLKSVLPLVASVAVSCMILKSHGLQKVSLDMMNHCLNVFLPANWPDLCLAFALTANSILF